MIEIGHLSKTYRKIEALRDVSLFLDRGQCIAMIGPNGSGKTTLMKSILQMVKPDSGTISVDGKPVGDNPQYRRMIGYLPQVSRFPEHMKVKSLFHLMIRVRRNHGATDTELYENLGIDAYAERALGTLSEGMRQKVNAALAFYFSPEILILDEPTASLDPVSSETLREKIVRSIRENRLVLISSHILSDLDELATHMAYLDNGRLAFYKELGALRQETGEYRLNSIVPFLLRKNSPVNG